MEQCTKTQFTQTHLEDSGSTHKSLTYILLFSNMLKTHVQVFHKT